MKTETVLSEIKIAIDPGKSGAIAIRYPSKLNPRGHIIVYSSGCESEMVDILADLVEARESEGYSLFATLEKVRAMPTDGRSSAFTFGANYGFWRGALLSLQIPFREVTAQVWQAKYNLGKVKGPERKRRLRQLASEQFPDLKPTLKTADAILMLEH